MESFKSYTGYIFNESGIMIKIVDGLGEDGCRYEQEDDLFVCRIAEDGEITGEFDPH